MTTTAFVFPGQGSQKLGMLSDVAAAYPEILHTFAEASDALGYDLWQLSQSDETRLNQTEYTQPAILTGSVALWRLVERSVNPAFMAGHSLGEYTALVCAKALDFKDAVKLVALRGRLMQNAVPAGTGAMAAVLGLDDAAVIEACAKAAEGEVVSAVNFNSPGQVVIAGSKAAVLRAMEVLKAAGAKRVLPLPVSVPSHCALMQGAAEELNEYLKTVKMSKPSLPIIHNVDVQIHSDPNAIKVALVKQLYNPVRWVETVQYLVGQGCSHIVECGPGKVLAGLNKRIAETAECLAIGDAASLESFKLKEKM